MPLPVDEEHQELVEGARTAIDAVFGDMNVPRAKTMSSLADLADHIESCIRALEADEAREAREPEEAE